MSVRPLVVSFVGPSGVGKTTVIESLVAALAARGLRVGTAKHAPHGFQVDREGSDSWRHRAAGAERVLLMGSASAVVFLGAPEDGSGGDHHRPSSPVDADRMVELLDAQMSSMDVVLVEGFAPFSDRVVVVERSTVAPKVDLVPVDVWLTVSDRGGGDDCSFGFDELDRLVVRLVDERNSA